MTSPTLVVALEAVRSDDTAKVGGKNASLGEMLGELAESGIRVPPGFATTADAYFGFLEHNDLADPITAILDRLGEGAIPLEEAGRKIRKLIGEARFPPALEEAITEAYGDLGEATGRDDPPVAVRSSATAEDLPEASFAGQLESFLNVAGAKEVLAACRKCYASLFTARAIAYRDRQGFGHMEVGLSVSVQAMVRADKAGAGVMFSIDTETGFPDVVLINAAWGLGESVVGGSVDPDQYIVFKPLLGRGDCRPIVQKEMGRKATRTVLGSDSDEPTRQEDVPESLRQRFVLDDDEICRLAEWAVTIEEHYGRPMDIEWAKDGESGELMIVQARPETVESRRQAATLETVSLRETGKRLLSGQAIGHGAAAGRACVLEDRVPREEFPEGAILVTTMTDPDWVPVMQRAAAIVTDHGGRTSHAAIVSRELGVPAVVGTGDATGRLADGDDITVSCAEGDEGFVYDGLARIEAEETDLEAIPETDTKVMLILANPAASLRWWRLPADGVGLARIEFIINQSIRAHPLALAGFDSLEDDELRGRIEDLTRGWDDKARYFVDRLARGIARIAASQYPRRVIVRLSDFKSNEYAELVGGAAFEPAEPNPMLGWRGASRYYSDAFRPGFELECRALAMLRDELGFDNVTVMVPFCRTPGEADRVIGILESEGVVGQEAGPDLYMMCEVPSNVVLAREFSERFSGFSIGSNDLTQLVLGVDRDSDRLARLFDEGDEAVRRTIAGFIEAAHAAGRPVGLCGQAPSDDPGFARFLVQAGIDSISVTPDSFLAVKKAVAEAEAEARRQG